MWLTSSQNWLKALGIVLLVVVHSVFTGHELGGICKTLWQQVLQVHCCVSKVSKWHVCMFFSELQAVPNSNISIAVRERIHWFALVVYECVAVYHVPSVSLILGWWQLQNIKSCFEVELFQLSNCLGCHLCTISMNCFSFSYLGYVTLWPYSIIGLIRVLYRVQTF